MKKWAVSKRNLPILAILGLSVFSHWIWFTLGIFTHGDAWYIFPETSAEYFLRITHVVWLSLVGFGAVHVEPYFLPFFLISGWITNAQFSYEVSFLMVRFLPVVVFSAVGAYFLCFEFLWNRNLAFLGSLFYISTTYFLTLQSEHLTIALAYAIAPITILCAYLFITRWVYKTNPFYYVIVLGLAMAMQIITEPRVFLILLFILTPMPLIFGDVRLRKFWSLACLAVVLVFLLNLFWILIIGSTGTSQITEIINRPLFGVQYKSLSHSITLYRSEWTGEEPIPFSLQPISSHFWLLPILAFGALLFGTKNRDVTRAVLFWAVVALIGIFLSKQNNPPLSNVYEYLYSSVPGFNLFRESSKFYVLVSLSYAILIPSAVGQIANLLKNRLHKFIKNIELFAIVSLSLVFCINLLPIMTGAFGSLFVKKVLSSDYVQLKERLIRERTFSRTFWIPIDSRWGFFSSQHPKVREMELSLIFTEYFPEPETVSYATRQLSLLNHPVVGDIFDSFAIKYIIVPLQDISNNDDFFVHYGGREDPNIRQWYIDQLDAVPWLKRIDIGTEELVVYENEGYKPHVFATTVLHSFDSTRLLDEKFGLVGTRLANEFLFAVRSEKNAAPLVAVSNPFETYASNDISTPFVLGSFEIPAGHRASVYFMRDVGERLRVAGEPLIAGGSVSPLNLPAGSYSIAYEDDAHSFANVVANGSFEEGTWQKEVGDCNNYDDNGLLAMRLNREEKTDGEQSLKLEATRHIACTSIRIPLTSVSSEHSNILKNVGMSGRTYLLSFDYQSPNAELAAYYVGFNDPATTTMSETLPLADTEWHTFSKIIEVPGGATTAAFYLYARATDGRENIINRYDNVQLIEVPDLRDAFYIVSEPEGPPLVEPREVTFELVNPTKKLVHVKGASTAFFLAMSESYHEQWQLQMNNEKVHGFFKGWWPFAKPDRIGDEYHYKLNGFLNAWYVDVADICDANSEQKTANSGCKRNADGSYDIEFVIEFLPQRWFYLGLLISGTTLAGCLGYLGYDGVRRLRKKYYGV